MLAFPLVDCFRPGQIQISWTDSSRPTIPEVEAVINREWANALSRPGIHLFDGPMCRMESFQASGGRLHLNLSRTSYRIFYGTNMHHPELADRHGQAILANSVGLSALLLSADGFAIMGRRNQKVAYYPGRVHPFAGCLEPGEKVDVFDEILREFREELSLSKPDFDELLCTGIAEDRSLRQPEIIFLARSKQTREQIESRLDPSEHVGIWHTPATAESVANALQSGEQFTPVAIAALMLYGRVEFGDGWFERHKEI